MCTGGGAGRRAGARSRQWGTPALVWRREHAQARDKNFSFLCDRFPSRACVAVGMACICLGTLCGGGESIPPLRLWVAVTVETPEAIVPGAATATMGTGHRYRAGCAAAARVASKREDGAVHPHCPLCGEHCHSVPQVRRLSPTSAATSEKP